MFHRIATDPRVGSLSQLDLFSDCSRTELSQVASLTTEEDVPAGKTLCRQGAVGTECFIVLEGEVTVDRDGAEIAILGPGAIFGEMALLSTCCRTANVRSVTAMRLLALHDVEFRSMLYMSPSVAEKVTTGARVRSGAWDYGNGWVQDQADLSHRITLPYADWVLPSAESAADCLSATGGLRFERGCR